MNPFNNLRDLLSISIVYHNSRRYIERALPSVLEIVRETGIECFLIDNASTDGSQALLQSVLGDNDTNVHLILKEVNLGFGKAHNLVLDGILAKYHLICNPDVILSDRYTLVRSVELLEANEDVGLATVRMLNDDGTLQAANKRPPTVLDLFVRRFLKNTDCRMVKRRLDRYTMMDVGYDRLVDVPFVSGAFLLVRASCLKAAGGFDPRYFLYFEDADLCREIQKTHRTVYFPDVSVVHLWNRAAHKDWRIFFVFVLNAMRFFNKWGWKLY